MPALLRPKNKQEHTGRCEMPNDKLANGIRGAVGVHSVYLAAKHDEHLADRFSHTGGKSLVDGKSKATKRSIANVMVYMAGKYGQQLTSEEVEMGLLAAASPYNGSQNRQKPGPNFEEIGMKYSSRLSELLTPAEIGVEIKDIIDRFKLYDPTTSSYRTLEQAVGVGMRMLGWDRRRQMTGGTRAYRWYPPEGYFENDRAEPEEEPLDIIGVDVSGVEEVFDDQWADEIAEEAPEAIEAPKSSGRKRSGVKPDEDLARRISTMGLYPGITSFEIALNSYDFDGNGLDIPKAEDEMPHKAKLSVGATMKSMDWTKKTRRMDGIPSVGWYPPSDWEAPAVPESTVRRKVAQAEEKQEPKLADSLPRLGEPTKEEPPKEDDDLPWPDSSDFYGDGSDFYGDDGDEGEVVSETETVWVKFVKDDNSEEVVEQAIIRKHTGTFLCPTEDYPHGRMLEWDAEEDIWCCHVSTGEE